MRSHPPTLLTQTKRTIKGDALLTRGSRTLVAVSGGRDSMALMHVLATLRSRLGFDIVAHGVDHGLREDAQRELATASTFASSLGIPFEITELKMKPGGNVQAQARELRYEALAVAMQKAGAQSIATAHHADDRAETVLLRILRGTGVLGLGVLPSRFECRIRPFFRVRRRDIDLHVERHQIPFANDPSNESRRFARTRVRREVMPLLEELAPHIVEQLNQLADECSDVSQTPPLARETRNHIATLLSGQRDEVELLLPGGEHLTLAVTSRRPQRARKQTA